jgi:hypothetical protein
MTTDREKMAERQDGRYAVPVKKEPAKKLPVPVWIPPQEA